MEFEIKKAAVFVAVKWADNFFVKILYTIASILLALSFFSFLLFSGGALIGEFNDKMIDIFFSLMILCFLWGIAFAILDKFLKTSFKAPKLKYSLADFVKDHAEFNAADFFDFESAKIVKKALNITKNKADSSIGLLLGVLASDPEIVKFVFSRSQISTSEFKKQIKKVFIEGKAIQNNWQIIFYEAAKIASLKNKERIGAGDLLLALVKKCEILQNALNNYDLNFVDIESLVDWHFRAILKQKEQRKFWDIENLKKMGNVAEFWNYGYTPNLDRFISFDYIAKIQRQNFRKIIGHTEQIKQVEQILSKTEKNCALLVGEQGTGKKSIIEAIAQKIYLDESTKQLNNSRIVQFDVSFLSTQTDSMESAESLLEICFLEAIKAGNIIMVIENIEQFLSEKKETGIINISSILSRYIASKSLRLIATTTYEGLHKVLERNPGILSQLEKVETGETSEKDTTIILQDYYIPLLEYKTKKFVSYKALRAVVKLSIRYLTQSFLPDKAIKLLDEAMAYLAQQKEEHILQEKHIKKILSQKTQIPLEDVEAKEKERLLNLESILSQRIVGQKEAIYEISSALRRARANLHSKSGPMGTFLFLGPTGVGKTETAKALSQIYFGGEEKMVRLDMSEFQTQEDIKRLLGNNEMPGILTTAVFENPFSLVLLDEIEKAHPRILDLFLQVLDEGCITDGSGKKISFQNTLIIATSNAGSEIIRQDIETDKTLDIIKSELLDKIFKQGIFRTEFINRFDGVIVFLPLTKIDLMEISHLLLLKVKEQLKDKGINFEITRILKEKIVELSYNPEFGAREMKRVIQDKIENELAKALLAGSIKRGDSIEISPANFNITKVKQ